MRKYMYDNKLPFAIKYIPESLCWTEVPATNEVLIRQRVRWARGLIQTLNLHKNMFFNKKYGKTAFLILPYFFAFEFMVPILELIGVIILILCFLFVDVNYEFFFYLTFLVYMFYLTITIISIVLDEILYKNYANVKELLILLVMAIIEPFVYHPVNVYASLKGYWHFFRQKEQAWGNMQRQGFNTVKKK